MADYRHIAEQFGQKFPASQNILLGSTIVKTIREINDGANGFAVDRSLAPELAIMDDDKRQLNAIVFRLNKGFCKADTKLYIKRIDPKRGSYIVQTRNEHLIEECSPQRMYEDQVKVAVSADKRIRDLDDVDEIDLSPEDQARLDIRKSAGMRVLERQRNAASETSKDLRLVAYKQIGIDATTAAKLLENQGTLDPLYRTDRRLASLAS